MADSGRPNMAAVALLHVSLKLFIYSCRRTGLMKWERGREKQENGITRQRNKQNERQKDTVSSMIELRADKIAT